MCKSALAARGIWDLTRPDVTCSPKPVPAMQAREPEAHLDCAQHWERIPSCAPQVWKRLSGWKTAFSGTATQCFVCAVTPVRSLLHALAPEVEQGFQKTAVERLGRSRRRTQGEVLITAMPIPGKGQK